MKEFVKAIEENNSKAFTRTFKILQKTTKQTGLNPDQISRIILKIPEIKIKPERALSLLLPNDTVLVKSVISIICWFNSLSVESDKEIDTMAAIITWVITIYPYIEDQLQLNQYYDLLMHYISSYYLAPYICHLLAFMTRAEDVKTYRVMKIFRMNNNSYFLPKEFDGLLILYKRLRTDDLNLNVSSVVNHIVLFTCPDEKMVAEICNLRVKTNDSATRLLKESPIFARRPIELLSKKDQAYLPQNWYNLFSSETVDCEHPMLTQLSALLFNQGHASLSRILFWIDQAICASKQNCDLLPNRMVNFLDLNLFPTLPFQIEMDFTSLVLTLTKIADFINQSIPTLGEVVKALLPCDTYPHEILLQSLKQIDLLAFLELKSYLIDRIRCELMKPIKSGAFLLGLFSSLCDMMNNWLSRSNTNLIVNPDKLTDISAILNTSAHHSENLAYAFTDFVEFAFMLGKEILYDSDSHLIIQVAVIHLLIQIAQIPLRHQIALLYLPHPNLIYKLFLTHSPIIFNCLFKLLANYFHAFEKVKVLSPKVYHSSSIQDQVEAFNQIMVVILYKLLPSPDIPIKMQKPVYTIPECVLEHFKVRKESNTLLICNHWALRGYVALYFETTQPAIESRSIIHHPLSILESKAKTNQFLSFLEEHCHLTGLTDFWRLVRNDH